MRFYTNQHQFYCGIDLHARSMYVCLVSQEGEMLVHRNMQAAPDKPRQNIVYLSAELNRLCRIRVSTDISIRGLSPVDGLILPLYSVVAHRNATLRVQSIYFRTSVKDPLARFDTRRVCLRPLPIGDHPASSLPPSSGCTFYRGGKWRGLCAMTAQCQAQHGLRADRFQAYFLARRVRRNYFPHVATVMWPTPRIPA